MNHEIDPCVTFTVAVLLIGVGVYAVYVWNDMSRRYQQILALWSHVQTAVARKQQAHQHAKGHIASATGHEKAVAKVGSPRGRPALVHVQTAFPNTNAVGTVEQGLSSDVRSLDIEAEARREHAKAAAEYNALLMSLPRCLVARPWFREWKFSSPARPAVPAQHHPRRHKRRRRRHRT